MSTNNYYNFIIVCNKISYADNMIRKFVEKLKESNELSSFNLLAKTVYTTDGNKFYFICKKVEYKFTGIRGMKLSQTIFEDILNGFEPENQQISDIMYNIYNNEDNKNNMIV